MAQDISFGPAIFHSLMSLVRQCEADLTDAPCLWVVNPNDWSMWFAISSLSPICSHNFSFMDGIRKRKKNWTWMSELFLQGHIPSTPGDARRQWQWNSKSIKPYVDEDPCVDKLRTCKLNFHPPCRLTIFKS